MIQGFVLWISLMVAIGPQNALVIKQGLRKHALAPVLAVVMISDIVLVALGILGVGAVVERAPWLLTLLRWGGVAYLLWFAYTCFRDARSPQSLSASDAPTYATAPASFGGTDEPRVTVSGDYDSTGSGQVATKVQVSSHTRQAAVSVTGPVMAALAMSWLNPGAYIDGIMLGSVANQFGDMAIAVGAGALCATALWFPVLGYGARALAGPLSRPKVWSWINIGIGVMIVTVAARIAFAM